MFKNFAKHSAGWSYLLMYLAWPTVAEFMPNIWVIFCDALDLMARMGLLTLWRVDDLGLLDDMMMALNLRITFLKHIYMSKNCHLESELLMNKEKF